MFSLRSCLRGLIVVGVLHTGYAHADCADILAAGIWEYDSYDLNSKKVSSFLNWYNKNESRISSTNTEVGGKAAVTVMDVPIELDITYSDAASEHFVQQLRHLDSGQSNYSGSVESFSSRASAVIAKAWGNCMNSDGFHVSVRNTFDPHEFWIVLQLRKSGDSAPNVTLTGLDLPEGVSCPNVPPEVGSSREAVRCTRTGDKAISIEIEADHTPSSGSKLIVLDEIVDEPPIPEAKMPQVKIFRSTGRLAQRPEASVTVPDGYKIVGGGALDAYKGYGNMLTASFPESARVWKAAGKDHGKPDEAQITAWAIAIFDPDDLWNVRIFQETGTTDAHPTAEARVPDDFAMVGGGARVNWTGAGSLLTASYPVDADTWRAKSKDHDVEGDSHPSPASITVYAIGIRPANGAALPGVRTFHRDSEKDQHPNVEVPVETGYALVGGGAATEWTKHGSLLTAMHPNEDGTGWRAASKDHGGYVEAVVITGYAMGLRVP